MPSDAPGKRRHVVALKGGRFGSAPAQAGHAQRPWARVHPPTAFPALRRVQLGVLLLGTAILAGTCGYLLLGWHYGYEDWTFLRCLYMTVITITTIGYGDVLGSDGRPLSLLYTVGLSLVGMGASLYVVSMATAFLVEGDLKNLLWSRRMTKRISKLTGHYIVCGVDHTGLHVLEELLATGRQVVVVDRDEETIHRVQARLGVEFPAIVGDATDDEVLLTAGVDRASGLFAVLSEDRDNLFLSVTARQLNSRLRIAARGVDPKTGAKLRKAGADVVVSTHKIGGLRLVSELVRPETTTFLDTMLRDRSQSVRFEDLTLPTAGPATATTLADLQLGKRFELLAVGLRSAAGDSFEYCPRPDRLLEPGMTLVVLGKERAITRARDALAGTPRSGEEG